jgi:predicted ABC-type ATPase
VPVLHLLVGPNGAGKTTLHDRVIAPATGLPFVNADLIASQHWPGSELQHAYDASRLAAEARAEAIAQRRSFVTETVFSHASKLELIPQAQAAGYVVTLHVVMIPEALAVARARLRSEQGGHAVPEDKVRARFHRLWPNVEQARKLADETLVYDNSLARRPLRLVACYEAGKPTWSGVWPEWASTLIRPSGAPSPKGRRDR